MKHEPITQPSETAGPTRSIGTVLLSFLAGSVFLPLLEGMAGKVGEDLYAWLRRILPGGKAKTAEEKLLDDGQVVLVDTVRRVIFQLPADLTAAQATAILNLRLPIDDDAWLLVRKDYARGAWVIEPVADPPTGSIEATTDDLPEEGIGR